MKKRYNKPLHTNLKPARGLQIGEVKRYTLEKIMNYNVLLVLLSIIYISTSSFAEVVSDEIAIDCKMKGGGTTFFIINPAKKQAKFVLPDSVVLGNLTTNTERHILTFPKTDKRWETRVIIERYTGSMVWEHGETPFGEDSLKNVHRSGQCEQRIAKPKL